MYAIKVGNALFARSNREINIAVCDLVLGDSELGGVRTAICIFCLSYLSGC